VILPIMVTFFDDFAPLRRKRRQTFLIMAGSGSSMTPALLESEKGHSQQM
jgi:hypothetical protein